MGINTIQYGSDGDCIIFMDSILADILLNNLLSNAIRYSYSTNEIRVLTTRNSLRVENPGIQAIQQPEKLFTRFYREGSNAQSSGLGLAIVQKICQQYKFDYSYSFENNTESSVGKHIFKIVFES